MLFCYFPSAAIPPVHRFKYGHLKKFGCCFSVALFTFIEHAAIALMLQAGHMKIAVDVEGVTVSADICCTSASSLP